MAANKSYTINRIGSKEVISHVFDIMFPVDVKQECIGFDARRGHDSRRQRCRLLLGHVAGGQTGEGLLGSHPKSR